QVQRDLRAAGEPGTQVVVAQPGQPRVGEPGGGRGARTGVEKGELAEHLAGPEHAEEVLSAIGRGTGQLDLALEHDVEPVAGLSLAEEGLSLRDLYLGDARAQGRGSLSIERGEQGCLAQHVVGVHFASMTKVAPLGRGGPGARIHTQTL